MEEVLAIVTLGRAARSGSNMKNRQPLAQMIIGSLLPFHLDESLLEIVKEELNVETIEFVKDASQYISYSLKPQQKTLGPKYGRLLGGIKDWLNACDSTRTVKTLTKGETVAFDVDGTEVVLTSEDVLISVTSKEGYAGQSNEDISVVLDIRLTEDLIQKGNVREIISKIQSIRKESNFEIADHIDVALFTEDALLAQSFEQFAAVIADGTLADSVQVVSEPTDVFANIEINGIPVSVKVTNRSKA